ncbi:MAG: glucose-6-phosphate dehydrogenase, partial [Gammaproteobacteria bacterium]
MSIEATATTETSERTCSEHAEPTNIVIFGATGDLTKRKLMPALIKMIKCGLVNPRSRIIGVVNNRSEQEWLDMVKAGVDKYTPAGTMNDEKWQRFSSMLKMVPGDLADDATYSRLAEAIEELDGKRNALFYCAIPPQWYPRVTQGLKQVGLVDQTQGYRRIVIEKPFGMDLQSARELNRELQTVLDESQI